MATNKPVKVEPVALTPWERSFFAFPLFHRLNREFDEVFNRFGLEKPFFENTPTMWTPELEVVTKGNAFLVKVDLPGMKKEDITLEVTDEHLILRGERKHEHGREERRLLQDGADLWQRLSRGSAARGRQARARQGDHA